MWNRRKGRPDTDGGDLQRGNAPTRTATTGETMKEIVDAYIRRHRLLSTHGLHIVALSGGADSVALLLVLQQLGYRVEAAHCNFNLRGEESQRDERFVESLCKERGVGLHRAHFDTLTYASLHHQSIEMAARELRYNYFEQLRNDLGAESVCVAHHRDDAVETLLMNLIRGTGIHGLTGLRPRNRHVVRPLLGVSRKEIVAFLDSQGQSYVTDSTNLEANALRNKLRLNVIPLLCQTWPEADAAIARTASRMSQAEQVYIAAIEQQRQQVVNGVDGASDTFTIDIDKLLRCPSPESLLFETLSPLGFTPAQCQQLAGSLPGITAGKRFLSASHQLLIDRRQLVVAPLAAELPVMRIPEPGNYRYQCDKLFAVSVVAGSHVSRHALTATLDAQRVRFPLTVRPIAAGDRFTPFGMKGSKLVSDYLTDRKVGVLQRQQQLVVADATGRIVWLVGHRTSGLAAVTDKTTETLTIALTYDQRRQDGAC